MWCELGKSVCSTMCNKISLNSELVVKIRNIHFPRSCAHHFRWFAAMRECFNFACMSSVNFLWFSGWGSKRQNQQIFKWTVLHLFPWFGMGQDKVIQLQTWSSVEFEGTLEAPVVQTCWKLSICPFVRKGHRLYPGCGSDATPHLQWFGWYTRRSRRTNSTLLRVCFWYLASRFLCSDAQRVTFRSPRFENSLTKPLDKCQCWKGDSASFLPDVKQLKHETM